MIGFLAHFGPWIVLVAAALVVVAVPAFAWRMRWPLAVVAMALVAGCFWLRANDLQMQMAQRDAAEAEFRVAAARENIDAAARARAAEQAAGRSLAIADGAYQRGKTDAQTEFDRIAAGVHGGTVVVRKRLQCPRVAAVATGVSEATGAAALGDGEAPAGLTAADAIAAFRIAAEGDDAIRQLTLAQDTIAAYQAMYGTLEDAR